jgi:hypothetical protein
MAQSPRLLDIDFDDEDFEIPEGPEFVQQASLDIGDALDIIVALENRVHDLELENRALREALEVTEHNRGSELARELVSLLKRRARK